MDPTRQTSAQVDERISAVAALNHPIRRRLYGELVAARDWVSRDEAASRLGVPRTVAAFHLDKLADAEVVEVRFERVSGRSGPGAGRPSKLYRVVGDELSVSVPPREYDVAGSILAAALVEADRTGGPVGECLRDVAHGVGQSVASALGSAASGVADAQARLSALIDVLERHGYEPMLLDNGEIAMANCPFHRLAEEQRDLVCGMNLDLLSGVVEGLDSDERMQARLDPQPGFCCVRISR